MKARWILLLGLGTACKDGGDDSGSLDGVRAIYDADRSEHYFDVPFPNNALLDGDGLPDLAGYPSSEATLAGPIVDGWASRLELTANGFGNNSAAYFRFEAPLTGLDGLTEGLASDPVLMVAMDGSELLPLELRFIEDPAGDPFYGPNTLAVAPEMGHPPASGGTYAVVVMQSAGAQPPEGHPVSDEVRTALSAAGVSGEPAIATVFTVQDATAQLRALTADIDARVSTTFFQGVELKRVAGLEIRQTTTPSGRDATGVTTVFEDGSSRTAYAYAVGTEEGEFDVAFDDTWPLAIFEGEIPILNYSGLEDMPYMSPGVSHVTDVNRYTGWIDFLGGELQSVPELEPMRITVGLPKDADGNVLQDVPMVIFDHGTGGQAYNAHQRIKHTDKGLEISQRVADAGWGMVGRDAALYGTRYPLIDEGYASNLGFYNVVNVPAFRDNQRQTAVDGHTLRRFLELGMNEALPEGSVDPSRVRRMGHSLGSVTTNLGVVASPGDYEGAYLSGTGGNFIVYFLETGLIGELPASTLDSLFALFGAETPDEVTTEAALGAALELPEEAWSNLDRLHPVSTLFQWTMDPSDPMAVVRDQDTPSVVLVGIGDYQVPNRTTYALAEGLEDPVVIDCVVDGDYDPHWCLHRMELAWDSVEDWLVE